MKCYWFKVPLKKGEKKKEREILHRVREKYCRKGEGGKERERKREKERIIAKYCQYKMLDKPQLMVLEEAVKNSERKK